MAALAVLAFIVLGPAFLLVCTRLALGPRAAHTAWRMFLRWAYVAVLIPYGAMMLWWAKVDGVAETDTGVAFGIALMLLLLLLTSAAASWITAGFLRVAR